MNCIIVLNDKPYTNVEFAVVPRMHEFIRLGLDLYVVTNVLHKVSTMTGTHEIYLYCKRED